MNLHYNIELIQNNTILSINPLDNLQWPYRIYDKSIIYFENNNEELMDMNDINSMENSITQNIIDINNYIKKIEFYIIQCNNINNWFDDLTTNNNNFNSQNIYILHGSFLLIKNYTNSLHIKIKVDELYSMNMNFISQSFNKFLYNVFHNLTVDNGNIYNLFYKKFMILNNNTNNNLIKIFNQLQQIININQHNIFLKTNNLSTIDSFINMNNYNNIIVPNSLWIPDNTMNYINIPNNWNNINNWLISTVPYHSTLTVDNPLNNKINNYNKILLEPMGNNNTFASMNNYNSIVLLDYIWSSNNTFDNIDINNNINNLFIGPVINNTTLNFNNNFYGVNYNYYIMNQCFNNQYKNICQNYQNINKDIKEYYQYEILSLYNSIYNSNLFFNFFMIK